MTRECPSLIDNAYHIPQWSSWQVLLTTQFKQPVDINWSRYSIWGRKINLKKGLVKKALNVYYYIRCLITKRQGKEMRQKVARP